MLNAIMGLGGQEILLLFSCWVCCSSDANFPNSAAPLGKTFVEIQERHEEDLEEGKWNRPATSRKRWIRSPYVLRSE